MINELKKLMKIQGVSSREDKVAAYIEEAVKPYVDEIKRDPLGNLICLKKGTSKKAKKIMLCAHMDEIGFMVNCIQDNGIVRVSRVGGINYIAYSNSRVVFENGAVGVLVPEGKTELKDYNGDKFYVDLGVKTKAEAERRVKLGEMCSVESDLVKLYGTKYAGRPFDDRIGCYVMIEIAKKLGKCKNDVYFVFSVQEEVGCRGSHAASYNVLPDIGIAFDVTPSGDVINPSTNFSVKLGDGAAIKIKDSSVMCDRALVAAMFEAAKANNIKHQTEVLTYGGTDTSSMQTVAGGSRAGCISIPTRFCHTQNEIVDMKDVEACIDLGVLCCSFDL
ncbi:MAG: M20/M25/M40 family metallo-hydrolase [Clostridia bacterium]|jgi:endoglucanase|nr:M20/M25/M40 family metallo-hydrolase [Clostridia bacterium]